MNQKEYQRKYNERKEILEKAFKSAIKYCIKNDILKDFLRKHGSEVINMLYAEYDPEEIIQRLQQKEPYADYE